MQNANDVNITTCRTGIRHPPVSFLETAIVEMHCSAKMKKTISPAIVAVVNNFSPELSTLAFLIAEIIEFCR